jgi:hypothetical protein
MGRELLWPTDWFITPTAAVGGGGHRRADGDASTNHELVRIADPACVDHDASLGNFGFK